MTNKELIEKINEARAKFPANYGFKGRSFYNDDLIIDIIESQNTSILDALKEAADYDYSARFEGDY